MTTNPVLEKNIEKLQIHSALESRLKSHVPTNVHAAMEGGRLIMRFQDTDLYDPTDPVGTVVSEVTSVDFKKKPDLIVLFGLGIGLHAEVLKKRFTESPVLVFEPSIDILCETLSKRLLDIEDMTIVNTHGHLMEQVDVGLDLTDRNLCVTAMPSYKELFSEEFERFKETIAQTLENMQIRLNTQARSSEEWTKHIAENLGELAKKHTFEVLGDVFEGVPGFFVGTGPSLDKNIQQLKRAKNRSLIIACNSALRPLVSAGIVPDMVAVIEGVNLEHHFEGIDCVGGVTLLPSSNTNPAHLRVPFKRMLNLILRPSPTCDWYTKAYESASVISGGSVACACFAVLHWLKCDPIIAVGMDLAFTDDRTHASRSNQENYVVLYNEQTGNLDQYIKGESESNYSWQRDLVPAWGDKGLVGTHQVLSSYRYWFEGAAQTWASDKTLINATEGGARFKDFLEMTLGESIDKYCVNDVPSELMIDRRVANAKEVDVEPLKKVILDELNIIENCRRMAQDASEKAAKAIKLIGGKKYEAAQKVIDSLDELEKTLREATRKTRLLNQLIGHTATRLRLDRFEDLSEDGVKQTKNSLKRSSTLFEIVSQGAEQILEMFEKSVHAI